MLGHNPRNLGQSARKIAKNRKTFGQILITSRSYSVTPHKYDPTIFLAGRNGRNRGHASIGRSVHE